MLFKVENGIDGKEVEQDFLAILFNFLLSFNY